MSAEYRDLGYYVEKVVECDSCKGQGFVKDIRPFTYNVTKDAMCYDCNGSGKKRKTVNMEDALRSLRDDGGSDER